MHTFPLPYARYRRLIESGADLITPQVRQIPAGCIDPRIKQRSRLHWWLADREVQVVRPGAHALLLDEQGHITETAAANIVIVRRGAIVSPPKGAVLDGVSLRVVWELSADLGISFGEQPLSLDDCLAADEAILTSTPYCVAGVSSLNGKALPFPGPIYRRLHDAWCAEVGAEIHDGFLNQ